MCIDSSTIDLVVQEALSTNNNILNVRYESDELHFDLFEAITLVESGNKNYTSCNRTHGIVLQFYHCWIEQ